MGASNQHSWEWFCCEQVIVQERKPAAEAVISGEAGGTADIVP